MDKTIRLQRFISRFAKLYQNDRNPRFFCHSTNSPQLFSWSAIKTFQKYFKSYETVSSRHVPDHIPLPTYIKRGIDAPPDSPDIKSEKEVQNMRSACKLASSILDYVGENLKVGITTDGIDEMVHEQCIKSGAYPSPLLYKGFPKSVCTSVNEVACHGIPSSLALRDGDIINVDVTVFYQGYHGDTSRTFLIGEVSARDQLLVEVAEQCRDIGIAVCHHGAPFADIGDAIYYCASQAGFHVIPHFCGHGIGTYFHGPPDIIHIPTDSDGGGKMTEGMTFTVEPIICDGSPDIKILDDNWTVVTKDGSRSAQFEHTILVTRDGAEILT